MGKAAYVMLGKSKRKETGASFLKQVLAFYPYKINYILTDNGFEFSYKALPRRKKTKKIHPFGKICQEHKIQHCTIKFKYPWTNGMVKNFNKRIKNKVLTKYRFRSIFAYRMPPKLEHQSFWGIIEERLFPAFIRSRELTSLKTPYGTLEPYNDLNFRELVLYEPHNRGIFRVERTETPDPDGGRLLTYVIKPQTPLAMARDIDPYHIVYHAWGYIYSLHEIRKVKVGAQGQRGFTVPLCRVDLFEDGVRKVGKNEISEKYPNLWKIDVLSHAVIPLLTERRELEKIILCGFPEKSNPEELKGFLEEFIRK